MDSPRSRSVRPAPNNSGAGVSSRKLSTMPMESAESLRRHERNSVQGFRIKPLGVVHHAEERGFGSDVGQQ